MARRKNTITLLDNPPHDPSGRQIMMKGFIGLIVGAIIALITFVILILTGGIIKQALADSLTGNITINPLLPLILLMIAFIGTFVGNLILTAVYNLLYTDKYYDMGKMFSISLLINIILFIFFVPIYIIFTTSVEPLFFVLALHVLVTVCLCFAGIEMTTNPNYSASALVGSARGFTIAVLIFAIFYKVLRSSGGQSTDILIVLPPILAYLCIPLFQTIWEKLYFKFYSMGNNFLYIPSLNEVMVDAEDNSEVNVDI